LIAAVQSIAVSPSSGRSASRGTRTPPREGGGIIGEILGAWIKVRRKNADRW
jgi:hypothetical protein